MLEDVKNQDKQSGGIKKKKKDLQEAATGTAVITQFLRSAVTEVNMVQKLLKIVELCSSLLPLPCTTL